MRTAPLYRVLNEAPGADQSIQWLGPCRLADGRDADLVLYNSSWLMLVWGDNQWAEWHHTLVLRPEGGQVRLAHRARIVAPELSADGQHNAPPEEERHRAILMAARRAMARGLLHAN